MKKAGRLKNIAFTVGGKSYRAQVFLQRPTAIVVPDQNIIAYTNLSPKPDTSTAKNRYRKIVNPTEREEAKIDRTRTKPQQRTIFDETGRLNSLSEFQYSEGEPFRCNYPLVFATAETLNI